VPAERCATPTPSTTTIDATRAIPRPRQIERPARPRSRRETTICRRLREPPGNPSVSGTRRCRELASRNYDDKPRPAGILDGVLLGYARVSTADQNPDHQLDALRSAGVGEHDIYIDHASGAKASRPKLDEVLRMLRKDDTLKITRLDRLGRSVLHLVTLGAELRDRGVGLHVIEQGIDTTTAEGRAMFGMLSVLAELQRELIVANTRDGLAAARARGRKGGRRPKLNPEQTALAQQLYNTGERTVQQIADLFSVPRTTIYGHLDPATKGKRPASQPTPASP
jgi:DNA invertase Pin-like site-specific DNA recombinase